MNICNSQHETKLSPFLLGSPHYSLLIFLVIREEKGSIYSGGRLLLDLNLWLRVRGRVAGAVRVAPATKKLGHFLTLSSST